MKNRYEIEQDQFDALLGLFSPNREMAGERYEELRRGLIRFFSIKGCRDPESLADETINRVAAKLHKFDHSRNELPTAFFYGFASKILLEYKRRSSKELALDHDHAGPLAAAVDAEAKETEAACLDNCLRELPSDERQLVIDYYSRDGQEKIEFRQSICHRLNCKPSALYTRVFRIRAALSECIDACIRAGGVRVVRNKTIQSRSRAENHARGER